MYKGLPSGVLFALNVGISSPQSFFYTSAATDAFDKYQVCAEEQAVDATQTDAFPYTVEFCERVSFAKS